MTICYQIIFSITKKNECQIRLEDGGCIRGH